MWLLILVILVMVIFMLFLVFRVYTMTTSLHDVVYALINQVVVLRDLTYSRISQLSMTDKSDLKLHSFWSQGVAGDNMIARHRLLMQYVDLLGTYHPQAMTDASPGAQARNQLLVEISDLDRSLNKSTSFDMNRVTMYTISMVDKLFAGNYDGSLLAVKGFLGTIA